jgi:hypothetical protein
VLLCYIKNQYHMKNIVGVSINQQQHLLEIDQEKAKKEIVAEEQDKARKAKKSSRRKTP